MNNQPNRQAIDTTPIDLYQLASSESNSRTEAEAAGGKVSSSSTRDATTMGSVKVAQRARSGMTLEILKLFLAPGLILAAFALGIFLLGIAQRHHWLESSSEDFDNVTNTLASTVSWICPMMCVPPSEQSGRCPVCAMELVPAAAASSGPASSIVIDARARRVAGIQTTAARRQALVRQLNTVGEIKFDETQQKTLSSYIDGRIEDLQADYTGLVVEQGQLLGSLYSPELYSAQVEYIKTLEYNQATTTSNTRVKEANTRLAKSSRQRLIELGLTESQIKQVETDRSAQRVLELYAPISGTVVEKMATVGQYVKAGAPIYRLADLSKVWLVLELFPEDAQAIPLGQTVNASSQSTGGESFSGTVEFIEPSVDPKMRTVGVRVAIDNRKGVFKPGELAQASLTVPLANRTDNPAGTVVIPRDSLLSMGPTSLAYVEVQPGEFEIRKVKTGPTVDGLIAIYEGIEAGENVVSQATFLIDAQMQLQGNPSLIDPDKWVGDNKAAHPAGKGELTEAERDEIRAAMVGLNQADQALAYAQEICPVTEVRLGSMGMGTPIKLEIAGRSVFICCAGCRAAWERNPDKYFKILDDYSTALSATPGASNAAAAGSSSSVNSKPSKSPDDRGPADRLPQMELPEMELPETETQTPAVPNLELPQMELPPEFFEAGVG